MLRPTRARHAPSPEPGLPLRIIEHNTLLLDNGSFMLPQGAYFKVIFHPHSFMSHRTLPGTKLNAANCSTADSRLKITYAGKIIFGKH